MKKTIVTTLIKTVWLNDNAMEVHGVKLQAFGSDVAPMPCILGEFGSLTLHGAN